MKYKTLHDEINYLEKLGNTPTQIQGIINQAINRLPLSEKAVLLSEILANQSVLEQDFEKPVKALLKIAMGNVYVAAGLPNELARTIDG